MTSGFIPVSTLPVFEDLSAFGFDFDVEGLAVVFATLFVFDFVVGFDDLDLELGFCLSFDSSDVGSS